MDVKDRIQQYIDYKGIATFPFEKSIGCSNGYWRKTKSISANILTEIARTYSDLSIEWAVTGEGRMLRSAIDENKASPINIDGELTNIEMEKEIKRLRASIDALIEKNERLEAELIKYREKESLSTELAG